MATLNQGLTLKQMVQDVAGRMGLPEPDSVISNTELTAVRILRLMQQSGMELLRRHEWQAVRKEETFTTVAAEAQTDTPLAADFDRFVNGSLFNRTKKREIDGPLTSREYQRLKALTAQPVLDAIYVRGGTLYYYPAPAAGNTVAFEYVSTYWIATASGSAGTLVRFAADTNTILLDEEMLIQDTLWRYRKSTGQNYAEDHRTAQLTILDRIARDGGKPDYISMGERKTMGPGVVIAEGSWPL